MSTLNLVLLTFADAFTSLNNRTLVCIVFCFHFLILLFLSMYFFFLIYSSCLLNAVISSILFSSDISFLLNTSHFHVVISVSSSFLRIVLFIVLVRIYNGQYTLLPPPTHPPTYTPSTSCHAILPPLLANPRGQASMSTHSVASCLSVVASPT